MNEQYNSLLKKRVDLVWIGAMFGLVYWFWQSFRDAIILEKSTFIKSLISPDIISLASRLLIISVFLLLCIHAKYLQEKILDEKSPGNLKTAIFAFVVSAVAFVMLYWILDSFQDIIIQAKGNVVERVFNPGILILLSRIFSILLLIALVFLIQYLFLARKKAEKALKTAHDQLMKSRENLNKIVTNDANSIFVLDSEGKTVFVNPAAERMFQKPVYEWIGQPFNYLISTESEKEIEIVTETGDTICIEALAVDIDWQGGKATMVSLRDVSERKHVELIRQNFLSLISHRLKSPIVGIMGAIDNMLVGLVGNISEKQREYLLVMQQNVTTKLYMIEELLTVLQLETGGTTVQIENTVLMDVVDSTINKFNPLLEEKGLSLDLKGIDTKLIIQADANKMTKVIQNVLHNAIKFTNEGGITIRADVETNQAKITIKDTGRGMSDETLESLFKIDKKSQSLPDANIGMGFGLYMAKNFMQMQGGDISASSTLGNGSCLTITIPCRIKS
ncbi:PAS domain-containing protein [candidate division KSB1 bacterium]|nr:PAS domain-containing protein [candidate division KSB1 bacterium]